MKESSSAIPNMAMAATTTKMGQSTKENGRMTRKMEKENTHSEGRHNSLAPPMRENLWMISSTEKAHSATRMAMCIRGSS